jgi:hypothetical protein
LKRQEAVEVLKEILKSCNINPSYVSLHPLNQADDYELHIRNQIDDSFWKNLMDIVQKHSLAVRKIDEILVIYTPKHNKK